MADNNSLTLTNQYPIDKYNVLVPVQTVAEIADIQRPVMNVVSISVNLNDKEIYEQEPAKAAYTDRNGYSRAAKPAQYALTRKGLLKLMRAAGIRIVSSKSVLPSTCQKCVEVNRTIGKPVNCGNCKNKDVKYTVVISAPQLTGQDICYECSREIIVADEIAGMSDKQVAQFMKFRAEHCESKALNRALRAAMLIKPTYQLEELKKPFVVAYLVPNLDNPDVRARAVDSFFTEASAVYSGMTADPQKRVVRLEDDEQEPYIPEVTGEMADDPQGSPDEYPDYLNEPDPEPEPNFGLPVCADCGSVIEANGNWTPDNIVDFSKRAFGRSLCPKCQRVAKGRART